MVDRTTREPPQMCKDKREEILKKWPGCFKEKLEKGDKIKHEPIKIKKGDRIKHETIKIKLKENSNIPPRTAAVPMIPSTTFERHILRS